MCPTKDLTKLKAALYGTSALDLSMDFCKQNLLPLAKQHVDPEELIKMYGTLCLGFLGSKSDALKP